MTSISLVFLFFKSFLKLKLDVFAPNKVYEMMYLTAFVSG